MPESGREARDRTTPNARTFVDVGSIVVVDDAFGRRRSLVILPDGSPISADSVTVSSPTGAALIGRKVGDVVPATTFGSLRVHDVVGP